MSLSDEERLLIVKLEIEKAYYDEEADVLQDNLAPAKEMIDTIAEMVK